MKLEGELEDLRAIQSAKQQFKNTNNNFVSLRNKVTKQEFEESSILDRSPSL